jgi:hypothetical protein
LRLLLPHNATAKALSRYITRLLCLVGVAAQYDVLI